MVVLDEVEPLLLLQRGFEIARLADQPGLALLADAALEHRLYEDELVAIDQPLDLVFRRGGAKHFGGGKIDMLEELRAVEHSGDLHDGLATLNGTCSRPRSNICLKLNRAALESLRPPEGATSRASAR